MDRINVIGSSGSGKTTLARLMATRLDLPNLELDSIHHLPGWQPIGLAEFRAKVSDFTRGDRWVVDGNYSKVRDIVWSRADTVVFLDLPRWRVMSRLVPRTARRVLTRERLWNGNRERMRDVLSLDPQRSIVMWSWTRHRLQRRRFNENLVRPDWSHITFVRLRSTADVEDFASSLISW